MGLNPMTGLLLAVADAMTYDDLLSQMEEHITHYKEAKLLNNEVDMKRTKGMINISCLTLMHKHSGQNVRQVIDGIQKVDDAVNLLTPNVG